MTGCSLPALFLSTTVLIVAQEHGAYDEGVENLRLQSSSNVVPRIGRRAYVDEGEGSEDVKRGPPRFSNPAHWKRGPPRFSNPAHWKRSTLLFEPAPLVLQETETLSKKGRPVSVLASRDAGSHWNIPLQQGSKGAFAPSSFLQPWRYQNHGKRSPPGFLLPWWYKDRSRTAKRDSSGFFIRPSWKLGKRESDVEKRRPPPPTNSQQYTWNNILRDPQGFRFHDSFLGASSRYKRAGDLRLDFNSVPLMGKKRTNDVIRFPEDDALPALDLIELPRLQRSDEDQARKNVFQHLRI